MAKRDAESRRKALRTFMESRKLKPGPWAKAAGMKPTTLYGFLRGDSEDMGAAMYEALATEQGVSVDELLGNTDDARMRIVAAAERLMVDIDIDDLTIPAICDAAHVRASVFLAHFSDVRAVLWEIVEHYNERSFADLRRLAPVYGKPEDRLSYVFRRYFEEDCRHLKMTAVLQSYSWTWTPELERRNQQQLSEHDRIVMEILEACAADISASHSSFTTISKMLMATYTQVLRHAVYDGDGPERLEARMRPFIRLALGHSAH